MNIHSNQTSEVTLPSEGLTIDEDKIRFSPKLGETPVAIENNEEEETPVSAYYKASSQGAWNKVEANTPQAETLQKAVALGSQVQEKLAELSPSGPAEIREWLESAQKALRVYHESNPNSEISRRSFEEATFLYEAVEVEATHPEKSKLLVGKASASHYVVEVFKREEPNMDIAASAYRALADFQKAINLLESLSSEPNKLEQEKKLKQSSYCYAAGNALLKSIKEELKPESEFKREVATYFTTASTYYEKASDEMAANRLVKGLYHFEAGSAYEELGKEELKPLSEALETQNRFLEIKNSFLQGASYFTGALITFDSNPGEAKRLAMIGKNYVSLAREYQKPEPNEEAIESLKKQTEDAPKDIQKVADAVEKQAKK